jgi:hypothetical protein
MGVACKVARSAGSEEGPVSTSHEKPSRTWAGHGRGTLCEHCHQPIEPDQIEYEVELTAGRLVETVSLHLDCYEEWIMRNPASDERRSKAEDNSP